ncbi:MAG: hypothetical protein ABSH56_20665 [Bryobacteraceae bacterium]
MNDHQSVDLAFGDQPCRNGGLPERRRSAEDAFVVGGDLRDGFLLERPKLTLELRYNRRTRVPFVPNLGPDLVRFEKSQGLGQTSARYSDVLDKFLAARDYTLPDIAARHRDLGSSLRLYFSAGAPSYLARFAGYTATEVTHELGERLDEADLTSSLAVLASVEAAFRLITCSAATGGEKTQFRVPSVTYTRPLEDEIFEAWVDNSSGPSSIIGELRGAFRFRHWLAHGRYWTPKLGRRYDFNDVFALAALAMNSLPFLR